MIYYKQTAVENAWNIYELDATQRSLIADLPKDQPVADTWKPLQMTGLWADMGRRMHRTDVPGGVGLVFPDTALEAARTILEDDGEFLRMDVRHEGTYWYYHCTTVIDALDLQHSKVKMFPSGHRIMRVIEYAFHDHALKDHAAFQIPQFSRLYYTQTAVDKLLALNLTGLAFEPIPMA